MFIKTFRNNLAFLIPYLLLLLIVTPVLVFGTKPGIHLWINQFHTPFLNFFFKYVTYLGDGLFLIVPALILLFVSLRHFVFLLTAYLSTGLVAQILKRFFFDGVVRPTRYFEGIADLPLVNGVKMLGSHSFPSGHATSAFALFLCLALITKSKPDKLMCFVLATLVAFSRVYLSQHFLIDVYFGSLIGCAGALAFYQVFYRDHRKWYDWKIQKILHHGR